MESLVVDGLDELIERIPKAAAEFSERKQTLLEQLGDQLKQEVDHQILSTGVRDDSGRVRSWQVVHIGSGRGYVAVRPVSSKDGGTSGKDGEGAITNYLSSGHRQQPGRYVPAIGKRLKASHVEGRYFYPMARLRVRMTLRAVARNEGQRFLEEAAERIVGKDS